MNLLHVWITLAGGETTALGELIFGDLRADGTAPSAFRYARSWLERRDAFPIHPDPQVLPLQAGEFQASNLGPPLQVFNDALPDEWGRRLIIAAYRLPQHQQGPYWIMRAVGGGGLGALSFSVEGTPPPRLPASHDLADLAQAAVAFDAGTPLEDRALTRLFVAGATPGGARPKALVASDGREWVAKFPSPTRDRGFDVVGLEATCLALARSAGLDVPNTKLVNLGERRALLVQRFDLTPEGGRRHMISLSTLCRESGGAWVQSYNEPAAAIRKFSDEMEDPGRFFRQMVFNAAIGNTDDHLKNFIMLRDANGYRLSPAFDLVPDVGQNREHVMAMGQSFATPSGGELVDVGRKWLGNETQATAIVDEVIACVANFLDMAGSLAVAPASIEVFGADIKRRLAILTKRS